MGSQPAKRYRVVGEYGPAAWTLFVAEEQTAGRGRLGRSWQVSPGTALLASVVLRPPAEVPVDSSGWVPLLAGLAITAAVAEAGVPARLKWPNDVVVGFPNRKLAGILAERIDSVLVVGFGLNVSADRRQLPVATATSLCLEGARQLSREELLVRTMAHLRRRWDSWVAEAGDARRSGIREEYLHSCETVGCEVKVELPGRETIEGRACDIDTDGRLVVTFGSTQRVVAAGDVVHVRRS